MKNLAASDRSALIRLAASLPVGSEERRAILAAMSKSAGPSVRSLWGNADIIGDYGSVRRMVDELSESIDGALDEGEGPDRAVAGLDDLIHVIKVWRDKIVRAYK